MTAYDICVKKKGDARRCQILYVRVALVGARTRRPEAAASLRDCFELHGRPSTADGRHLFSRRNPLPLRESQPWLPRCSHSGNVKKYVHPKCTLVDAGACAIIQLGIILHTPTQQLTFVGPS